jgi:hypothetical protein
VSLRARVIKGALVAMVAVLVAAASAWGRQPPLPRATADRPDSVSGPQVHIVYALPSDGADRSLDIDGTLTRSVTAWERWLAAQTGGPTLRLDRAGLALDITFARLSQTDAQIAASGAFVRDVVEDELDATGLFQPGKIYAVYYDGSSTFSCGGGAWPPALPGVVGALYLLGTPPGAPPCASNSFAPDPQSPGYLEFAMLHELVHTLGFVATCAPNHTLAGHTSAPTNDLMYAGSSPWSLPPTLDPGHDDYYGHSNTGCNDLADSPFLTQPSQVQPCGGGPITGPGRGSPCT